MVLSSYIQLLTFHQQLIQKGVKWASLRTLLFEVGCIAAGRYEMHLTNIVVDATLNALYKFQ